jgi:hypothetical protein
MAQRVLATPQAAALLEQLRAAHGPLLLHVSGGCCEGSAPMCLRQADFKVGPRDVLLGVVAGVPVYAGAGTYEVLAHSQIVLDLTDGGGDSFSIEAAEGRRFVVRSRIFTDAELQELAAAGSGAS